MRGWTACQDLHMGGVGPWKVPSQAQGNVDFSLKANISARQRQIDLPPPVESTITHRVDQGSNLFAEIMDVLQPPLIFIDGRCYRKNFTKQQEESEPYVEEDDYFDPGLSKAKSFFIQEKAHQGQMK